MCKAAVEGYWTLNDGGNQSELYLIDTSGNVLRTLEVGNLENRDWESLAVDDSGNLYIGDFGNNDHNRSDLRIARVSASDIQYDSVPAETFTFSYEDQSEFPPKRSEHRFDCEAHLVFEDSIYLFTKNWTLPFTGMTYMYVLPLDFSDSIARLRDSAFLGENPFLSQVTDVAMFGGRLALLGYGGIWTAAIENAKLQLNELQFRSFGQVRQFEAMEFTSKNRLLIAEEKSGVEARMYIFDLSLGTNDEPDKKYHVRMLYEDDGIILPNSDNRISSWALFTMAGKKLKEKSSIQPDSQQIFVAIRERGVYLLRLDLAEEVMYLKFAY